MTEKPKKRSEFKEKPAVSAVVKAHDMLIELCGQRGWNDTRESWLTRGARKARLSVRRARAIFYQEPIRLTADEYLSIEAAFEAANAALASLSHLASEAEIRADRPYACADAGGEGSRRLPDSEARSSALSALPRSGS